MPAIETLSTAPAGEPKTAELACAICAEVIAACVPQFSPGLRAIVLTGSMARGEATTVGRIVLGDAEFLLIFHDGARIPASAEMHSLSREIENNLSERFGIACPIDLSGSYRDYLRKMQPHIFAYELRECGKVVWGDPEVLDEIPPFAPGDIPLEDGWRLLSNRLIEHLASCGARTPACSVDPRVDASCYPTAKLCLDMATSLLLFAGAYAPSYRQRADNLRLLAKSGTDHSVPGSKPAISLGTAGVDRAVCPLQPAWPFPLEDFAHLVDAATRWKLGCGGFIGDADSATRQALALWRWELARLTGLPGCAGDRALMHAWTRRQSVAQRLRGWVHVVRAEGWLRSWRSWPRWMLLARRGSPRYCVYAACARAAQRQSGVREYLPVRIYRKPEASLSWPEIASEVLFNYKRFLVETRA